MKSLISTLLLAVTLCSCSSTKSSSDPRISDLPPSPVEPAWVAFTRAPIVSELEGEDGKTNFAVSDEFVKKSAQQQNYIKKVKTWKTINSLP